MTSSNGCSATANAEVTSDDAGPTVALQAGDLNCNIQETVIDVTASSDAVSYTWTGPEGFSSEEKEPEVSTIGLYTIMVLGDNGCVSTNEIFIDGDYSMPNVTAAGGKISCSDNETSISGATTTPNAVYSWSGPNDFASSLQNPFISQPGTYILTVIGENGCTASAEAVVEGDGEIPIISASGGKIDCVTESVMIIGAVEGSGATTVWTGPNGFSTSNLTAEIDIPGSYIFTATSPGGCKTFASVEVLLDNSDPTFSLMEGEVDCDDAQGQFLLLTDAEDPVFQWTGPNGFSSTEQVPEYTLAGKYDVTITGGNSCISTGSITVDHDIAYSFDVSTNGGDANIEIIGGTPTFIILWNGVTAGNNVTNLNLGENFVSIEDGLGCSEIFFFDITSSTKDLTTVEGIRVYPNPAGDFLNLELSKELSKGEIRIFNQQGMTVQTSAISNQVDVSSLATGLYYLRLTAGEADYFYKFIKQ